MFTNGFGWPHLLIIVAVFVLLFGAKRLPDAARSVGKSMKIFKAETKGLREDGDKSDDTTAVADEPKALPQAATPASSDGDKVAELQKQLDELKKQQTSQQKAD